jgi:hypothetical protein
MELDEYAIWLEFSKEGRDRLSTIITQLAKKFGTAVFEPHLTMLGGIPITIQGAAIKMKELYVAATLPLILSLEAIEVGETFYQALYITCEPTKELIRTSTEVQKTFGITKQFQPHISLLYGDVSLEAREGIKKELKNEEGLFAALSAERISLWHAKGTADHWKKLL